MVKQLKEYAYELMSDADSIKVILKNVLSGSIWCEMKIKIKNKNKLFANCFHPTNIITLN